MCKNSDIKYNSTLKGGIKAGNFTDLGKIAEMSTCIRLCCGRKDCDVALMLEANCYAVNCYNEDLCQPVLARKSGLLTNLSPRLSFITSRDEEGQYGLVCKLPCSLNTILSQEPVWKESKQAKCVENP